MTTLTQSERLAKVEEKTDGIDHKIDKLDGKIDTMIDKLDEKYASKWVESAMSKLIATVCLAVLAPYYFICRISSPIPKSVKRLKIYMMRCYGPNINIML